MALNTLFGRKYSDSFITVTEFDTIVQTLPDYDATVVSGMSNDYKEYILRMAAQIMGFLPLRGRKAYELQALCFPRTCQLDVEEIPDSVKRMQAALAYQVIHRGLSNRAEVTADESYGRLKRLSIGGILHFGLDTKPYSGGNILDAIVRSIHFPIYVEFKQYFSQIRGGVILPVDEMFYHTLSSTSTTSTSTTVTSP